MCMGVWPGQEGVNWTYNYSFQRANARQEEVLGGSTEHKWELADQERAKPPHCHQCSQPERRKKAPISQMVKRTLSGYLPLSLGYAFPVTKCHTHPSRYSCHMQQRQCLKATDQNGPGFPSKVMNTC